MRRRNPFALAVVAAPYITMLASGVIAASCVSCAKEPPPLPPAPQAVQQPPTPAVAIPVAEFTTPVVTPDKTIIHPDGTIEVPAGQPVEIHRRKEGESKGPQVNQKETATGKGSSVDARGEKVDASLKSDAPSARLGTSGIDSEGNTTSEGGAAMGAAFSGTFKVLGQTPRQWAIYAIAVICIAGGAVLCYFQAYKMGVCAILLGVLFFSLGVVAETYPIVFVIVVVLAILSLAGIAVYAILAKRKADNQAFALNRVVDAVDTHVESTGDRSLLRTIRHEAEGNNGELTRFDKIIDQHKAALGILNKTANDPLVQERAEVARLRAELAAATGGPTITTSGG